MTSLVLFVGTTENRFFIDNDSDDEMPNLINKDGTIFDQNSHPTDLEKHKDYLVSYLHTIVGSNLNYHTVDPSYTNNKKQEHDDVRYKGHYSTLLEDLDSKLDNKYDMIVIMNCYKDLFTNENIDKLNRLGKSKKHKIKIVSDIQYNISDYMKTNLNYQFIYI